MKRFLIVTAALEGVTGIALSLSPSLPARVLLGASLDTTAGLVIARVAGAALVSLALVCGLACADGAASSRRGVVASMLVYDVAVAAILAHAGLGAGLSGVGLWPAVGLHSALAAWSVACLRK